MTRRRLQALVPRGAGLSRVEIGTTGLSLGPFSSNLSLFLSRD